MTVYPKIAVFFPGDAGFFPHLNNKKGHPVGCPFLSVRNEAIVLYTPQAATGTFGKLKAMTVWFFWWRVIPTNPPILLASTLTLSDTTFSVP